MSAKKTTALEKPKTRKVQVHESTRRQYVEDEPVIEEVIVTEEPEQETDPISDFFTEIDESRSLRMCVWALPSYMQNRKTGRRAPDSIYVTDFTFSATETETYRSHIQTWYPQGGMFYLELRDGSRILKSWSEQIAGVPGYKESQQQQLRSGYPMPQPQPIQIINPRQQQEERVSPLETMREQFSTMKEMVGMVKDLMPPPTTVNVGESNNHQQQQPENIEQNILLRLVDKVIDQPDGSKLDRVLDALGNRKPTGFLESLGPFVLEIIKQLPTIAQAMGQFQRTQPMPGQPATMPQQQQLVADPAERAWRRVVQRITEDCQSGMGIDSCSHAILDLGERYAETQVIIGQLLNATPAEVIGLCAALQPTPEESQRIQALAELPAMTDWIAELQKQTKEMLAEGENEGNESMPKRSE